MKAVSASDTRGSRDKAPRAGTDIRAIDLSTGLREKKDGFRCLSGFVGGGG